MILPAAMTLWVAMGQLPLATEAELPTGEKVTLAADQLIYEPSKEMLIARGHTVLQTASMSLRADEVVYDQGNQKAWAKGNVMFVSGMLAAVAEEVSVDMRTYEANVTGGLFLRKRNVTEAQLLAARTPQELKKAGETVLTITGSRIKRIGPNEFKVDDLSFTPCDCDPTEPSWRVEANSAEVEMGERAILTWPVVYVYRLPVFALPWLYLPLSERRTGLLIPRPNFSGRNGLSLEQPVFVTLGDSYDLTFTPGFYNGPEDPVPTCVKNGNCPPDQPAPTCLTEGNCAAYGIRGARLHTEFRYVPSEHTNGRATVGLLYDLRHKRNPLNPADQIDRPRGLRLEASLRHDQNMGDGWRNRIDAGFVSDGYYFRDVTTDVIALQSEYLRSTAVINRKDTMSYFGVDAVVRQPIFTDNQPFGFDLLRKEFDREGNRIGATHTFARFPAVTWVMPERSLLGPIAGGVQLELARLAPVWTTFGDEGTDGVFRGQFDPDGTQGNGRFDAPTATSAGEREARERLDIRPQLSAPLGNRFVRFTPYLGLRETVYLGEVTGKVGHRGYPLAGASLSTTLARSFGDATSGFRHAMTPRVEMRYVPFVLGGVPDGKIYDDVDAAVRGDGLWQMVAEVRQELALRTNGGFRDLLRLDLGQGWDLRNQAAADTFGRLSFTHGPFTASAVARYDLPSAALPEGRIAQVSGNLNLDNGRGAALYVSYDRLLGTAGSDPLRAGIDELVGEPLSVLAVRSPETPLDDYAEQVVGGFRALFPFGLGVRYEAVVQPRANRKIPQQLIGLSYGPGCDCWRLEVHAYLRPDGAKSQYDRFLGAPWLTPDFGASLTIHQFGSFGAGG